MRRIALLLSVSILMALSVSLTVTSAPVDISVEEDDAIVNIDVCNAGKQLLGGGTPAIPSTCAAFVDAVQKPEKTSISVHFDPFYPVTDDPPPKTRTV